MVQQNQKISNQESLLMLNVETEPIILVYPTSHLCVILHFLIFSKGTVEPK